MPEILLRTVDLCKSFPVRRGFFGQHHLRLRAVDRVNISITAGETLGLVGESGCGKSTLGLTLMRLYEPTSGSIYLEGRDFAKMSGDNLRQARPKMQMIFQDPYASVDPRMTVEEIIMEPLVIQNVGSRSERYAEVDRLLKVTGMPTDAALRYPSEFSGGQQQRIGIARALALQPKLLICDEPVSALDVSVQATILNLLKDLQDKFELTFIFISHNMAVTSFMSRRIAVMYLGQIVEIGPSHQVVTNPRHPYTIELLKAVPEPDPKLKRTKRQLLGDVPSPIDRPSGCSFHPRCPIAQDICSKVEPPLRELGSEYSVACHFA
jgi:oligopeptide/dipeptide ABC transporter ATP-binding protein